MFDPGFLAEIKARTSLVALIGQTVKLNRAGRDAVGLCPFHTEKTPSFNVVEDKGFFHCFGCGAHGDAIGFIMRQRGVDFAEAVDDLAGRCGLAQRRDASTEALKLWLGAHPLVRGDPVDRYLLGRAVDLSLLGRAPGALRFHPHCFHQKLQRHFPAMVAAISDDTGHLSTHCTFLEIDAGTVVKIPVADRKLQRRCYGSYRGGSIKLARGGSKKAWRDATPGDVVVLGEGIEDTLTAALALPECRAAAAISGGNFKNIALPNGISQVILVTQNDERAPGDPDWWDRAERHFAALGCRVRLLRPPVFVKDVNDYAQWLAARPDIVEAVA